jgi:enamine deaminase RidA (YjgF/YER057c/UK114 family)
VIRCRIPAAGACQARRGVFLACAFTDHPKVINGCWDLFVEVFGDRGRHARCAVGMGSLPFNMTIEIEAVLEASAPGRQLSGDEPPSTSMEHHGRI